jgi:hypothetical protein
MEKENVDKLVEDILSQLYSKDWVDLNFRDRDRLFKICSIIKNAQPSNDATIQKIKNILNDSWIDYCHHNPLHIVQRVWGKCRNPNLP